MTDPVDTDALRTPYDHFPDLRQAYSEGFERGHIEVDRLRAVIENAPHDSNDGLGCGAGYDPILYPCTCWKADAL